MRFSSGFIKLERETFTKHFEGDGKLWATYCYLAMNVNWSKEQFIFSKMGKDYTVGEGEFYTTYQSLHHWLGFNFRTLKQHLERLKKRGLISLELKPNCMCIVFLQSSCNGDNTTNEEYKNIRINKDISKDISSRRSSKKSLKLDQEDQKTKSDRAEKRKNTSPEAQEGVSDTMSPDDLFRLWNEHCGALPKCRILSESRKKKCKIRLKENPDPSYWKKVIEKLSKSTFANEGKWASFDWIIKNIENPDKAFSGNYDNKKNNSAWAPTPHDPDVKSDIEYFFENAIRV